MSNAAYRSLLLLLLAGLLGDIVFTSGFALLRLPPGGPGLPVNEVLLVGAVVVLLASRQPIGGFAGEPVFLPLLVLWPLAAIQLAYGFVSEGVWAIRDAANIIETGFLLVGYCLASDPRFEAPFHRWLGFAMIVAALHILLFPLRDILSAWTPAIGSMSGYQAPLLFSYGNPASVGCTAMCYLLVVPGRFRTLRALLAAAVVATLLVFVQARLVYLQLPVLALIILAFRPRFMARAGLMATAALLLILLLLATDIDLPGRLGQNFSIDFLVSHVGAIWGGGGETTSAAAAGVGLRLAWWAEIEAQLEQHPLRLLFGLGYGMPLTSFLGPAGDIVREPHNSIVSIYGRLGLLGCTVFLALQAILLRRALAAIGRARRQGLRPRSDAAMVIFCFLVMQLLFSMVEGGLEVSYGAVPYYFFAGVALAWSRTPLQQASRVMPPGMLLPDHSEVSATADPKFKS